MKVLMLGRTKLMEVGGGDKVQIVNTAEELRKLGVEVDTKTDLNFDPTKYDLVHAFQLDWTPETYFYAEKVKEAGVPFVLSPIHHNVKELKIYDDIYVFDFRRISKYLFKDQFNRDIFKEVFRSVFDPSRISTTLYTIIHGLKNMERRALEMADVILVQTKLEAKDLKDTFNIDFKWHVVVNGVSDVFINNKNYVNKLGLEDYIICVGRIEPRKNQLSVIKAVKALRNETGKDIKLVFIGLPKRRNHIEYNLRFFREVEKNNWIKYVDYVPYEEMPNYYHFAKVCVSASWFETTGLTLLEALFCGTNAVAAGSRAKEYLGDMASYCKPEDIDSIKRAIQKELKAPRPKATDSMHKSYTWKNAAYETLKVYKDILK